MKKGHMPHEIEVAIDIGTTKICVLVGKKVGDVLEIIAIGKAPSDGLAKGVVVDIARAAQSIRIAKKEAELMAGITIDSGVIGISGSHIDSIISQGMVAIKKGQVRESDVAQAIAAARTVSLPQGQQILHVLPQFFLLDGQSKLKDPIGMYGVRLEVQVNIITGAVSAVQNLIHCCQLAGASVNDVVLEPLASAKAVLSDDERELGVAMLDIGGGTSDFVIYQGGSLRFAYVLPVAGNHFTQDIAICLRTPIKEAERIKIEYGTVIESRSEDIICAATMHGDEQLIEGYEVREVLSARATEMLMIINRELEKHSLKDHIVAGLMLTGGGSELRGLDRLASHILAMPVRIGAPRISSIYQDVLSSPRYATGYGLLKHACEKKGTQELDSLDAPLISRVFWRMKSWVSDFF